MRINLAVGSVSLALSLLLVAPSTSHADIIYLGNGSNTIERFDSVTGADLGVFASAGLKYPLGMAFDSAGDLYVVNFSTNTIVKFTPQGVGSVFATNGISDPGGLAFDSAGNLYLGNGANTIEKFTMDGTGTVFASTSSPFPEGLAFDKAGNLYVANYIGGTIDKF